MSQNTPKFQGTPQARTQQVQTPQVRPQTTRAAPPPQSEKPVVPIGTLMIIGVLLITTVFMWMLVLGIQQGRA